MAIDPAHFSRVVGLPPDDWQRKLLQSTDRRILLNCSRQSGKTTTIGTLEAHAAIYLDGIQIINVSPGLRQSRELFRKVMTAYRIAGKPVRPRVENKLELELANDSRVVALPGSEGTIRGFSGIDWLVFEEAARIPDELYHSVRPMIATRPDARIIIPSTPFGTRGFFYDQWLETVGKKLNHAFGDIIGATSMDEWAYFEVNAEDCPRISSEFLEEERTSMGDWWFQQEYMCKFMDAQGAAFRSEDIARIVRKGITAWQF
ncbi:MAG: terminase large subunit domain-containing protein [Ktedonobacteraceae bacterium]